MYNKTKKLMGTDITITIFGEDNAVEDVDSVFSIFYSLELEFSRFLSDSSLSKLNKERTLEVSDTFIDVIKKSKEIYADTDGYFNPLINLRQIGYSSDFYSNSYRKEDIGLKTNLDLDKLEVIGNKVILQPGQNLDLGGIVKGYGVDLAKEYLDKKGYKNYIVDAGGDIYTAGLNENGGKIVVGIDSPFVKDDLFATLELENKAIATSGNYKRKRIISNQEYNHIINPITETNNNEIISISLIGDNCYLVDAYATACVAMGVEKTLIFLEKNNIDGIIICTDKKIFKTTGIKKYNTQFF